MLWESWTIEMTNKECSREANGERNLNPFFLKWQSRFSGHTLKRGRLEPIKTEEKINRKRGWGRPREKIINGLMWWHDKNSLR